MKLYLNSNAWKEKENLALKSLWGKFSMMKRVSHRHGEWNSSDTTYLEADSQAGVITNPFFLCTTTNRDQARKRITKQWDLAQDLQFTMKYLPAKNALQIWQPSSNLNKPSQPARTRKALALIMRMKSTS